LEDVLLKRRVQSVDRIDDLLHLLTLADEKQREANTVLAETNARLKNVFETQSHEHQTLLSQVEDSQKHMTALTESLKAKRIATSETKNNIREIGVEHFGAMKALEKFIQQLQNEEKLAADVYGWDINK
jgi:DNA-binding transcriptional regulator YbjK